MPEELPRHAILTRIHSAAREGWTCRIKPREAKIIALTPENWRRHMDPATWLRIQRAAHRDRGVRLSQSEVTRITENVPPPATRPDS